MNFILRTKLRPLALGCFLWAMALAPQLLMAQTYEASVLYKLKPYNFESYSVGAGDEDAYAPNNFHGATPSGVIGSLNGYSDPLGSYDSHATLWQSAGSYTDLNPGTLGFSESVANGTDGSQVVGYAQVNNRATADSAVLWNFSTGSATNLTPQSSGLISAFAWGVGGGYQVGWGDGTITNDGDHALLWHGTASSLVDLNPTNLSGYTTSEAYGVSGVGEQVGYASGSATSNNAHAFLWKGAANTALDLNPSQLGATSSVALDTTGGEEVGYLDIGSQEHAALWHGSSQSAIDLNSLTLTNYAATVAYATNGSSEVGAGYSTSASNWHALMWRGSATTEFDLQNLLPSNINWASSYASGVDSVGNIFGTAIDSQSNVYSVEWVVPEPSSASAVVSSLLLVWVGRRRGTRVLKK
jgi:hypothetical protein